MESKRDMVIELAESGPQDSTVYLFDLFVVHAAADTAFVRGYLLPALDLPPPRVLLIDELTPGALILSEIERGVSGSRFTVVVLSDAYPKERWAVFGEQLASHQSIDGAHVIPLRLADCELPLHLNVRVSLDFKERNYWDLEIARLRELLDAPAPVPALIACPYPGMRAFAAGDFGRFFGRDREIDDLIARLDRGEREIYVIGPSGSGKSSLVHAGLLHVLDAGSSRLGRLFVTRTIRPGERPTDQLTKALEGDLTTLEATVNALVARRPPAERVLVVVDQLEEIFTLAGPEERQRFTATLHAVRKDLRCYLVLTLRADFYGAFMDSALWPQLSDISRLDIAPLRGEALAAAIIAPAKCLGVHLEARLCDRLVSDAAGEPGVLPLVQETLRMLWDLRRQRYLGVADYETLGNGGRGLYVAIAMRANMTMSGLTETQQMIARRILLRLVSFGEGRADTRRQLELRLLRSATDDEAEFWLALQRLVENRLVTLDGDAQDHDALADLSHEALITAWPEFRRWIEERKTDEQRRRRLDVSVSKWIDRGRGTAGLLDAVELAEAKQWMQSEAAEALGYPAELSALTAASWNELDKAEQQRRERTLSAYAIFVVLSIVISFLGLVAWGQRQDARRIRDMNDMEQGLSLMEQHPMQAIPYFATAQEKGMESPELQSLFDQASANVPLVTLNGDGWAVTTASFSPDGTRVVTASWHKMALVWNAMTGEAVTVPLQHREGLWAAAFSADGTRVVTASVDHTARVWDAMTGKPVTRPLEHRGAVTTATFSADGTRVVTASLDRTAQVWDAMTGELVTRPLEHRDAVGVAVFSADGRRVATASRDGTARIWDATTGMPVTDPLVHQDEVTSAAFSADSTRLVTASRDGTARIWDATTGKPKTDLLGHHGGVSAAAFSADGTRVVTASLDKTARIWDARTGKPMTDPLEHHGGVVAAAFSADGTRVVTASLDKTARVWDATTGKPVTGPLENGNVVWTAAFSPDGTRVVTASGDGTARVWNATKPVIGRLERRGKVWDPAFSPDGTRVVMTGQDSTARMWDAMTGKLLTKPFKHGGRVTVAAFSADGTRVVTASLDKTARVWDAMTGNPVIGPLEHKNGVTHAAFSADGTRVVTASLDETVSVWDATTGKPVTRPFKQRGRVTTVAFNTDGTRVVTGSWDKTSPLLWAGAACVWDVTTGNPVTTPLEHPRGVLTAAFSADGTRVITASSDGVRVWDMATGKLLIEPFAYSGGIYAAAFSVDGKRVVTTSWDNASQVWDVMTGMPVTGPLKHQDEVVAAAFSADGARLVTTSADHTVRVWDATTGTPVTQPLKHHDDVVATAFSADGARVVTACRDMTVRAWELSTNRQSNQPPIRNWTLLAHCSPYALRDGQLIRNPEQARVCTAAATYSILP